MYSFQIRWLHFILFYFFRVLFILLGMALILLLADFHPVKASELIKDHRKMPKRESDSMWNVGQSVRTVLMY